MKERRFMLRIPCLLIGLTMLLLVFGSCNGKKPNPEKTTPPPNTTGSDDGNTGPKYEYDENGYIKDRLPADLSLKQRSFQILQWSSYQPEFVTDAGADDINHALYNRIQNVEQRLKCYVSVQFESGDWDNMTTFIQKVYNDSASERNTYDLVGQYSFVAPSAAMYGCYANLSKVDYLDFEMPWWDSDLLESAQLSGKTYFATGDIAPTSIYQNFCMFFNHNMVSAYQDAHGYSVNDLYDLVLKDGGWTLEVLQTMTKDVYDDVNHNGEADTADVFGLNVSDFPSYDAFFYACGMKIVEKDGNGDFSLSSDFTGMKTSNLIDELRAYLIEKDEVFEGDGADAFQAGRAMFALTVFNYPINKLNNVNFKYGVLPVPKYDSSQDRYYSSLAAPYTLYSIPVRCQQTSDSGALMEALASDAYRNISPKIFEEALKLRYSGDYAQNAEVFDLIRASRVYDVGRIYGNIMSDKGSKAAFSLFRNSVQYGTEWGSTLNSMKSTYISSLQTIRDAFALLD